MDQLKKNLPRPLRRRLRWIQSVQHRLFVWYRVATRISGFDAKSRIILSEALRKAPLSVWSDLDEYQMPIVSKSCTVIAKGVGIFHIRPFTDDLYAIIPRRELQVEKYIRKKLKKGDVFVDAGSNIGYYTILASRILGNSGKVIARS